MNVTFESLGLSPKMLHALDRAGYNKPTPIQAQSIEHVLEGRNVIGCAATGTGKTAAFMVPVLERAVGKRGTRALVLSPTRELAEQTAEYVQKLGPPLGLRAAVVVGGLGMGPQITALRQRRSLIVATPGRLIDHIGQRNADLSTVETLVLDEADRMLDMGFRPQLERILSCLPNLKQTLLFSATMAGEVKKFSDRHIDDPVMIEVHRSGTTAAKAEQEVFRVQQTEKGPLLMTLLAENEDTTLVFVRTKRRADRLAKAVERAGHKVARIHGDRSQAQRRQALAGFKDGRYRVLVATDVAARGIDVAEIGHVINYDIPTEAEDYIHRIGRTARNEASGRASTFAEASDRGGLLAIERLIGAPIPKGVVPKESPIFLEELQRRPPPRQQQGERPAGFPPRRKGPGGPGPKAKHPGQGRRAEAVGGGQQKGRRSRSEPEGLSPALAGRRSRVAPETGGGGPSRPGKRSGGPKTGGGRPAFARVSR